MAAQTRGARRRGGPRTGSRRFRPTRFTPWEYPPGPRGHCRARPARRSACDAQRVFAERAGWGVAEKKMRLRLTELGLLGRLPQSAPATAQRLPPSPRPRLRRRPRRRRRPLRPPPRPLLLGIRTRHASARRQRRAPPRPREVRAPARPAPAGLACRRGSAWRVHRCVVRTTQHRGAARGGRARHASIRAQRRPRAAGCRPAARARPAAPRGTRGEALRRAPAAPNTSHAASLWRRPQLTTRRTPEAKISLAFSWTCTKTWPKS